MTEDFHIVVLTEGYDEPEVYGPFEVEWKAEHALDRANCEGFVARIRPAQDLA